MTCTYSSETFLPPVQNETYLQIRDKKGIIRHKIYNGTLSARYIIENVMHLKVVSDNKILKLDFNTELDAANALVLLSDQYNIIRMNAEMTQ
jgi:hypothetical protein